MMARSRRIESGDINARDTAANHNEGLREALSERLDLDKGDFANITISEWYCFRPLGVNYFASVSVNFSEAMDNAS
jgi:hypothetical protein